MDHAPAGASEPDLAAHARRLRNLLARRHAAQRGGASLEATSSGPIAADAPIPPADEVLGRVDSILRRMPADELPDPAAFESALKTLFLHGEGALRKLALAEPTPTLGLSADQLVSLEAIVVTDGSRPSFLLRQGSVALDHPFVGEWREPLSGIVPTLPALAAAVGRVQPAGGHASRYIGTGTLVDRAQGQVLTNFHVVDDARRVFGVAMEAQGNVLRVLGELHIDFDAESGSAQENLFRVVEVRLPPGAGRGFDGLDAAVLRIEPAGAQSRLPAQAAALSADPGFAGGASPTLCTIGFPGEPARVSPPGATVDWDFVISTLFGRRFGVKRLAPGRFVSRPGSNPDDTARRVLTHDATTFGGASGSLLLAWQDPGAPAFGLHFVGQTLAANHAVALARAAEALLEAGVPLAS